MRDGLLTRYDQGKCKDMLRNTNKHFQEAKVVNFDIIHRKVWGKKVPEELLRHYQTLRGKRIAKYPVNFQKQI